MENTLLIMMYYKIRDKTNTEYYVVGTPGKLVIIKQEEFLN